MPLKHPTRKEGLVHRCYLDTCSVCDKENVLCVTEHVPRKDEHGNQYSIMDAVCFPCMHTMKIRPEKIKARTHQELMDALNKKGGKTCP